MLCHVTRFCSTACYIPRMTTSHVGHVYKYAYGAAYDRACAGLRTHTAQAAMCRIHVAPSRRPSDVLLSSRNSALHSYRITYMLCARLLARLCRYVTCVRVRASARRTRTHTHTCARARAPNRAEVGSTADVTAANYAVDSVDRFVASLSVARCTRKYIRCTRLCPSTCTLWRITKFPDSLTFFCNELRPRIVGTRGVSDKNAFCVFESFLVFFVAILPQCNNNDLRWMGRIACY